MPARKHNYKHTAYLQDTLLDRNLTQNVKLLKMAISFSVQTSTSAACPAKAKTLVQTYYSLFYPPMTS